MPHGDNAYLVKSDKITARGSMAKAIMILLKIVHSFIPEKYESLNPASHFPKIKGNTFYPCFDHSMTAAKPDF